MDDMTFKPGRLALILGTAAFFVTMPAKLVFNTADGIIAVKASQALAKNGGDDDGNDDDRGGGDDDDHDDDHSGGGGDDDSSDDDDDSSDDDSSDDDSSDDDSSDDDSSDDDSSDDDSSDDSASNGGTTGGAGDGLTVQKFEASGGNVEVTYSDGSREEIENGVYERKDSSGDTVEERPATQADMDRLLSLG